MRRSSRFLHKLHPSRLVPASRAYLNTKTSKGKNKRKLIDFWVKAAPNSNRYHYVELKVAFDNKNLGKRIRSWRADFEKLKVLVGTENAAGVMAVIFGIGFDKKNTFEQAIHDSNLEKPNVLSLSLKDAETVYVGVLIAE